MNKNLTKLAVRATGRRTPKYNNDPEVGVNMSSVEMDFYTEYLVSMELKTSFRIDHNVNGVHAVESRKKTALRSLNSKLYDGFLSLIDEAMHKASNEDYMACMDVLSKLRSEVTDD